MRVAVPLFGRDIAPRFGFAERYLLAVVGDNEVQSVEVIEVADNGWAARLAQLKGLGVEVLLAGGFHHRFVPYAESLGIRVMAGLFGDAEKSLEAYAKGEEMPTLFCNGKRRRGAGAKNGFGKCEE